MARRLPFYYGWVIVGTVATILMATSGARFLFGVVLKSLSEDFDVSRGSLTAAVLLNMVILSVLQPVVGLLSDRVGARRILVSGAALCALMLFTLSQAQTVWHVYLIYGLLGAFAFAATSPVNTTTLVNRWFHARRGTALALATSGTALGQLIIVPAAAWFLTMNDWHAAMRALAILLVVILVPLGILLIRNSPEELGLERDGSGPKAAERTRHVAREELERGAATLAQALRTGAFWLLAWGFFVCGFTMSFANVHFMAFADDIGMNAIMAADVISVTAIFSVIGTVALGIWADRWRRSSVLAITYALRGCSFLILFAWPTEQPMFLYGVVLGISWTATTPLTAAIAADLFGRA
ncbi:MAG: MFS transporter, partial [Chloroflexota bacterium]|nr:MFS transporter [Chloroflexota bacterium]